MDIKARRKGRSVAGRRAKSSTLEARVEAVEREVDALALTDKVHSLAARVARLEETDSN